MGRKRFVCRAQMESIKVSRIFSNIKHLETETTMKIRSFTTNSSEKVNSKSNDHSS